MNSNWIDLLATITKKKHRIHSSTKLTPIQDSLKKNEGYVYQNLLDKRKKNKPKFQVNDLVRVADLQRTFSKDDTTNWSYNLYKIAEIINDTVPSYRIDILPERYNESLLKKTDLTLKEDDSLMKKKQISFKLNQSDVEHLSLYLLILSLNLKYIHKHQQELLLKI